MSFSLSLLLVLVIMANIMPFSLVQRLRSMNISGASSGSTSDTTPEDSYAPTPTDIVIVRIMLTRGNKWKLPPDIVDAIFDQAEYWAHSSNEIDFKVEHKSALRIVGRSRAENRFLVCCSASHFTAQRRLTRRRFAPILSVSLPSTSRRTWPRSCPTIPKKPRPCHSRKSMTPTSSPSWPTTRRPSWSALCARLSLPPRVMTRDTAVTASTATRTSTRGPGLRRAWRSSTPTRAVSRPPCEIRAETDLYRRSRLYLRHASRVAQVNRARSPCMRTPDTSTAD